MNQDYRTSLSLIYELIEFGQFIAAGDRLDRLRDSTHESAALRQLLTLDTGQHRTAYEAANALLAGSLTVRARLFCFFVTGRAECLERRTERGIGLLRQALQVAREINDSVLIARAQGRLCHALLQFVSIEAALPELPRLRECGYVAGDARALTQLHCYLAEIELRQSRYGAAAHHLRLATLHCDGGDIRMTAQIGRLRANIALLSSRPIEARQIIEPVIEILSQNGARFPLTASLSTLGEACVQIGEYHVAQLAFKRMLDLDPPDHARLAALDSLMQIALIRRDIPEASEIQRSIDQLLKLASPEYYSLTNIPTRAKWLVAEGRSTEGLKLLRTYEQTAVKTSVSKLIQTFGFAEVETLVAMHMPLAAAERLCRATASATYRTLEDVAEINRLAALTQADPPASFGQRAQRIRSIAFFAKNGSQPAVQGTAALRSPLEIVYSVAALFSMPLSGEVLAHEVAALLKAVGNYEVSVATEQRSLTGNKVVKGSATHAARVVIDTGVRDQPVYAVIAAQAEHSEAYLAMLALQDLVSSAVALGKARERESDEPSPLLENPVDPEAGIVIASNGMRELVNITRRVATSNVSVLFTGETGSGKELFAKALHDSSGRSGKQFIPFNCTAVSRDMIDSQLFGYRRGAFTGAHDAFPGVIRAAAGGTLFLDEIGEISLEVQPKLLRFLESGEIHPLGEPKPITVDVRVVAATNAKLEDLVAQGRFREDLFYRLNVVRLHVPPLRERREEIPLLVQHFLDRFSRESHKTGIRIAEETMEYLILFKWPGNVRQLANEIRRLVALTESGAVLMPEHLSNDIAASRQTIPVAKRQITPTEFVVRVDQPISAAMEHVERSMIKYALEATGDRLEEAAQMLGLSRKGLYLKRLRLKMLDASLRRENADEAAS